METVFEFIKNSGTYYLATVENGEPRVRPFGTINIFEKKLYIQTGKAKNVYRQIINNPNVEICAMYNGDWLRLTGILVNDNRIEAKTSMLENYPELKSIYSADDENTQVFYFQSGKAVINSFTKEPIVIEF